MAADTAVPERQPPPAFLAINNLSSNNPFRNRLSMQSSSPRSLDQTMQQFPFPAAGAPSKNPFLDPSEPPNKVPVRNNTAEVEDIFRDMSVKDGREKPAFSNGPLPRRDSPVRSGTLGTQQRPSVPDERRDRPPTRGPPRAPDSPIKRPTEHRRRASESSVMEFERQDRHGRSDRQMDRADRPPRTESEERRRRERRREREERYRREKERIQNGGRPRKGLRNLDLIDKLDVTGVYGQGLFHHDGPFDACNPARNAKKDRRAPMQAFPEGSMNMALGGSGPNRSRIDLDKFHGRAEEGFNDFSTTRKADTSFRDQQPVGGEQVRYFNPTDRTEQVHGVESYGLGTSTFLEGAPASKSALQRRESDEDGAMGGGLQRKKSIVQRLRGMSASQPRPTNLPRAARSPIAVYNGGPVELSDGPTSSARATSAGGPSKAVYTRENEVNLFDNEYDRAFERRGTEIKFADQSKPTLERTRTSSSPKNEGLSRSLTADAAIASQSEEKPSGGGLLNRMKSLKGGRRTRPERKESNS